MLTRENREMQFLSFDEIQVEDTDILSDAMGFMQDFHDVLEILVFPRLEVPEHLVGVLLEKLDRSYEK